ncbi:MAG: GNAT family N-acetyltransferase [Planctomycetes bacterium]|nr:GNAT family N-acetyltransferase [Planctomycetota bacterium]
MILRDATPADADAIARCIAMAEGEMIRFFTGTDDEDKGRQVLAGFVCSPCPNRYSLSVTQVAAVADGVAGAALSFPADRQPELDRPILDALAERGVHLDRLLFEGVPGTYYLSSIGVHPAFRGQGIGTALMRAAEARGASLGFREASLLVAADKERARALYERLGYAAAGEVRLQQFHYIRMTRSLAAP